MRSVMNAECHGYQYTHFKLYNKLCLQSMNRIVWCLKRVYTYHHANSRNRLNVRCERTMSCFTGYMTKHQKRYWQSCATSSSSWWVAFSAESLAHQWTPARCGDFAGYPKRAPSAQKDDPFHKARAVSAARTKSKI